MCSPPRPGPVVRSTHPPVQWAEGALSLNVKLSGRGDHHSPPSCAEIKYTRSYIPTLSHFSSRRDKLAQGQLIVKMSLRFLRISTYENALPICAHPQTVLTRTNKLSTVLLHVSSSVPFDFIIPVVCVACSKGNMFVDIGTEICGADITTHRRSDM